MDGDVVWKPAVMLVRKGMKCRANLLKIACTVGLPRADLAFGDRRQKHGRHNDDNRDHEKHLHQRERTPSQTMPECFHSLSVRFNQRFKCFRTFSLLSAKAQSGMGDESAGEPYFETQLRTNRRFLGGDGVVSTR